MNEAPDILLIERAATNVLLLRLNRPEKRNALATDLLGRVADALDEASIDPDVRTVVITGSDRFFAAGADINELASRDTAGALADPRPAIWARIRGFAKPLIAAVEGWSLGAGNELVMCCDLVIAADGAKFGQPETNLGIIPGAGGTATLPRLVGRSRAMKMVLLGDPLSARGAGRGPRRGSRRPRSSTGRSPSAGITHCHPRSARHATGQGDDPRGLRNPPVGAFIARTAGVLCAVRHYRQA